MGVRQKPLLAPISEMHMSGSSGRNTGALTKCSKKNSPWLQP